MKKFNNTSDFVDNFRSIADAGDTDSMVKAAKWTINTLLSRITQLATERNISDISGLTSIVGEVYKLFRSINTRLSKIYADPGEKFFNEWAFSYAIAKVNLDHYQLCVEAGVIPAVPSEFLPSKPEPDAL